MFSSPFPTPLPLPNPTAPFQPHFPFPTPLPLPYPLSGKFEPATLKMVVLVPQGSEGAHKIFTFGLKSIQFDSKLFVTINLGFAGELVSTYSIMFIVILNVQLGV